MKHIACVDAIAMLVVLARPGPALALGKFVSAADTRTDATSAPVETLIAPQTFLVIDQPAYMKHLPAMDITQNRAKDVSTLEKRQKATSRHRAAIAAIPFVLRKDGTHRARSGPQ
jgi:hypothetical protein